MKLINLLACATLLTGANVAQAQDVDIRGMQAGLSMLELNVDRILDDNGFDDVDPTSLDLRTIVEIVTVVDDDDNNGGMRQAIQAALERQRP